MLADRKEADAAPPPTAGSVTSLVPLPEILSEIVGGGGASQGVARAYDRTSGALGPDFAVLQRRRWKTSPKSILCSARQ
jgi:DNA helicase II / ATP-dependent DNA helicase PcrA